MGFAPERAAGRGRGARRLRRHDDAGQGAAACFVRAALERVGRRVWRAATAPTAIRSSAARSPARTAAGFAAGIDYRISPGTVVGVALAVGETRWKCRRPRRGQDRCVAGRRLCRDPLGPLYLSGAVAFANHDVDRSHADVAGTIVSPPTSMRRASAAGSRAAIASATPTTASRPTPRCRRRASTRRPTAKSAPPALRLRADLRAQPPPPPAASSARGSTRGTGRPDAVLTLRGRAAWVHDYDPGAALTAAFQALRARASSSTARRAARRGARLGRRRAPPRQRRDAHRQVRWRIRRPLAHLCRHRHHAIRVVRRPI